MWCHDAARASHRRRHDRRPDERTRRCALLIGLVVSLISLLVGCAPVADRPASPSPADAGWIVADPAARLAEPPGETETPPPAPTDAVVHAWDDPVCAWVQREIQISAMDQTDLPRAVQGMAYLTAAMADALRLADQAQADGRIISANAVLAATAAPILTTLHPLHQEIVAQQAATATWVVVWQSEETPQSVAAGQALGRRVAEQVLTRMAQDSRMALHLGTAPEGVPEGIWTTRDAPPLLPTWGQMRPIGLTSLQPLTQTVSAPPAWTDAVFVADREAFATTQRTLTEADRALVRRWSAIPARVRDRWMQHACDQAATLPTDRARAQRLAQVSVAMHHATLATWDRAYAYQVARPAQWAIHVLPDWTPLVESPALPSYPAGEVAIGSAATTVLTAYDSTHTALFQADLADLARASVVSGQHWPLDIGAGQRIGVAAAMEVLP